MPELPIPPPLESMGNRPFSFYPPIIGLENNEWIYEKGTWSEILVRNTRTKQEIWIPKRYVGELSRVDEPVMIAGLMKELEYKGGMVVPCQRRVVQMPTAGASVRPAEGSMDRPVSADSVGSRMSSTESRIGKLIMMAVAGALFLCLLVIVVQRGGLVKQRVTFTTHDQSYLELSPVDDYYAVVRKLGQPARDTWKSESGELQYRALSYPERNYTVILMGTDRKSATYIGVMDKDWNPVHSVQFRNGGDTSSMLRGLSRF